MTESVSRFDDLVVVAIGRNEGQRLRQCLESVVDQAAVTVYVDSGSTDDSVAMAEQLGVAVVELATDIPFTAARARNVGFEHALSLAPSAKWVQFVDGDCEVRSGWLQHARGYLHLNEQVCAVCGRRRERYPENSVYNQLCDIEWDTTPGQSKYFGGDVLIRCDALQHVGGYNDSLIAGEEPELAVRLRAAGWKIYRLDREMTFHDANITKFSQWWKRMQRSGWAYAAGVHLHGQAPEYHWVWQSAQAWIWVAAPLAMLLMLLPAIGSYAFLVVLIYPLQGLRLFVKLPGPRRQRAMTALAYTVVRFPEFVGQLTYLYQTLVGRRAQLIEYK